MCAACCACGFGPAFSRCVPAPPASPRHRRQHRLPPRPPTSRRFRRRSPRETLTAGSPSAPSARRCPSASTAGSTKPFTPQPQPSATMCSRSRTKASRPPNAPNRGSSSTMTTCMSRRAATRRTRSVIEVEDSNSVRRALIPEQSYSPFELGVLGRFVDFEQPVEFVGRRALEREQARGGPPRRLVGLELDWEPLEAVPRQGADADAGAGRVACPGSCVRASPPDRQGNQHDMEPDAEEGGWAGVSRCRPQQTRHEDRRRVDGGSAAQPDGGDGGGAAVLQPDAQDLDGRSSTTARCRRRDPKEVVSPHRAAERHRGLAGRYRLGRSGCKRGARRSPDGHPIGARSLHAEHGHPRVTADRFAGGSGEGAQRSW